MSDEILPILSEKDLQFLVALNASEESFLFQLLSDIEGQLPSSSRTAVLGTLKKIVHNFLIDDIISLCRRILAQHIDLNLEEASKVIESDIEWQLNHESNDSSHCYLYLTNNGFWMWENGFPDLTRERENFLVFEQANENNRRIKGR